MRGFGKSVMRKWGERVRRESEMREWGGRVM